jgi:hypothetical protein
MLKDILNNAPEGATHYLVNQYDFIEFYIKLKDCIIYCCGTGDWVENQDFALDGNHSIQDLEDIKLIVDLQDKITLLK